MQTFENKFSVNKPFGNITIVNRDTDLQYKVGTYTFDNGTVQIYSEKKFACFSLVKDGKVHQLTLSKLKSELTDRQLIVNAGKFARKKMSE